jgi:DNA-binding MarR family transcriptional regulator
MYAVRLTQKGESILSGIKPVASKVDQRILSVLRNDQRGAFLTALGEIVHGMSRRAMRT